MLFILNCKPQTTLLQKSSIPFLLIYSRLVLAAILLASPFVCSDYFVVIYVVSLVVGVATDFFDGVLARRWNVSSEKLRIWDSNVDQVFWSAAILSLFYQHSTFIKANWMVIALVIVLEISAYVVSLIRFKKTIATHSILAKIWTVSMLVFLIDLCLNQTSSWSFWICIVLGIISRMEIILIILLLKQWATDVPSVLVVSKINRGEKVKKSRLFNS